MKLPGRIRSNRVWPDQDYSPKDEVAMALINQLNPAVERDSHKLRLWFSMGYAPWRLRTSTLNVCFP